MRMSMEKKVPKGTVVAGYERGGRFLLSRVPCAVSKIWHHMVLTSLDRNMTVLPCDTSYTTTAR